jgi:hypothetical protein
LALKPAPDGSSPEDHGVLVACTLHDGRSPFIKETAMSNAHVESLPELSVEQLSTANGGQQAEAAMQAIKGTGQLIGCARQAFDEGLRYGNAGYTANGGIIMQVGPGLSAAQRANMGLEACLKGAQDTAGVQRQLGLE